MKKQNTGKKTFRVTRYSVYTDDYVVEADSPEEARNIVWEGGGDHDEESFEWSFDMDSSKWEVEEVKPKRGKRG